jgi:formylmethanofuran dehydrogenase subunit B
MKQELRTTCPFCSLHCADLRLSLDGGRLARFSPPCRRARRLYADTLAGLPEGDLPPRAAASLRAARRLLQTAHQLLVVLSNDTDNLAVESAIRFSKHFSATLTCENEANTILSLGMKMTGLLTSTLGEARSVDQVVLCDVQPERSHPRLGEFIGKELLAKALHLHAADPFEALRWLRLGMAEKGEHVPALYADHVSRIRGAPSGVVFFGLGWLKPGFPLTTELLLWLRDLNRTGRWYAHYLSPGSNDLGVTETLLSLTGYSSCMRFRQGEVDFSLPKGEAEKLILTDTPDLCLLVGQPTSFSPQVFNRLKETSTILLDAHQPSWKPRLWLPVAKAGVDTGGMMQRLDGVPVTLTPVAAQKRQRVQDILEAFMTGEPRR